MSGWRSDDDLRRRVRSHLAAFDEQRIDPGGRRRAAVAVAMLSDSEGRACFALTRRAASLRAHSGQWALPGGGVDVGESVEEAACRELHEELGVAPEGTAVLGTLDDYATRSGFVITPVVVWLGDVPRLVPNADEVASVHRVPLDELDRDDAPRIVELPESEGPVLQMPIFEVVISPPTAAIVYQFREVALHGRATRVAGYDQPGFAWR